MNGHSKEILSKNDTIMDNKLDFELLDKYAEKTQKKDAKGIYFQYYWMFTETDYLSGNTRNGFVVWQTPPKPAFFKIYKEYHPNGYLRLKGKRMGGGATMIEEWEYYDEKGQLTSKKNEDDKFGKFSYNELLLFLQHEGHLNLVTGENREKVDFGYNVEIKQWNVYAIDANFWVTEYVIDGETGEVISKKEYQGGQM